MFGASLTWGDLAFMLRGTGLTLTLTFWAVLGGTLLGTVSGILRASAPRWANWLIGGIFDIFRSVPLLISADLCGQLCANCRTFLVSLYRRLRRSHTVLLRLLRRNCAQQLSRRPAGNSPRGKVIGIELLARHDMDCLSRRAADRAAGVDQYCTRRHEGHRACVVDRGD